MKFEVVLKKSEEGYSVHCPVLRGCWSQGETENEAIENIRDAIQLYLETVRDTKKEGKVVEIEDL